MGGIRSGEGSDNPEVYLTLSPRFERVWLETKKQLPEYVSRNRPMPNETEHDGKDLQLLFYGLLFPGVGGSFSGFASGKYSVSIRNFSYCSWLADACKCSLLESDNDANIYIYQTKLFL